MKLPGEKCAHEMINVSRTFDSRQNGLVDAFVASMLVIYYFIIFKGAVQKEFIV